MIVIQKHWMPKQTQKLNNIYNCVLSSNNFAILSISYHQQKCIISFDQNKINKHKHQIQSQLNVMFSPEEGPIIMV